MPACSATAAAVKARHALRRVRFSICVAPFSSERAPRVTESLLATRFSCCHPRWSWLRDKPAAQLHMHFGIALSAGSSPRGRGPPIVRPVPALHARDYAHIRGLLPPSSAAPHESHYPAAAHTEPRPAFPDLALQETRAHYCHLYLT